MRQRLAIAIVTAPVLVASRRSDERTNGFLTVSVLIIPAFVIATLASMIYTRRARATGNLVDSNLFWIEEERAGRLDPQEPALGSPAVLGRARRSRAKSASNRFPNPIASQIATVLP